MVCSVDCLQRLQQSFPDSQAWLKKLSRRKLQQPGAGSGTLSPALIDTVTEFFKQDGFVQVRGDQ